MATPLSPIVGGWRVGSTAEEHQDLAQTLTEMARAAEVYAQMHMEAANVMRKRHRLLSLPTIVLSIVMMTLITMIENPVSPAEGDLTEVQAQASIYIKALYLLGTLCIQVLQGQTAVRGYNTKRAGHARLVTEFEDLASMIHDILNSNFDESEKRLTVRIKEVMVLREKTLNHLFFLPRSVVEQYRSQLEDLARDTLPASPEEGAPDFLTLTCEDDTEGTVDATERSESVSTKLLISAYSLVPFVLAVMLMYAVGTMVRRSQNKSARGGFFTRTVGGDVGLIAGSSVAFYGLTLGMMFIPNLVKPSKAKQA